MSNLYAQFWNPEAHREDYLEVDPGYAQAMLAVDPKATRAALMKSGPGVRALIDQFYPNSTDIADLSSEFRPKLTRFLEFLREQGITESIAATLRHPLRSLVFDSAIRAASSEDGLMRAQVQCIRYGVPIDWHHYRDDGTLDVTKSQSMAAEVKKEFGIGSKASRGVEDELGGVISRHNLGNGVDMHLNFSFSRKAIEKDGKTYVIRQDEETPTRLANGSWWLTNCGEKPLARLGNDVFGVTRVLEDDAIHWSATGR
jgi:acyl transferase domain-containing protein